MQSIQAYQKKIYSIYRLIKKNLQHIQDYHYQKDSDIDYHYQKDSDIDYHYQKDSDIDYHYQKDSDIDYHYQKDSVQLCRSRQVCKLSEVRYQN